MERRPFVNVLAIVQSLEWQILSLGRFSMGWGTEIQNP
ncbi:hypothetical protein GLIP_3825 [Aliiglaciecola lipolytica E3]|uniref:Uncharacterized protein n=1 Tax=Aliiglaciecola lipolytica E3 TaxID=1127673 RepID=K6XXQ6_9ALTE|nr:hypothetical protein GLIP_3825 [Aliiglaciecola lipolytica E3]